MIFFTKMKARREQALQLQNAIPSPRHQPSRLDLKNCSYFLKLLLIHEHDPVSTIVSGYEETSKRSEAFNPSTV